MSSNEVRATTLARALRAGVEGDRSVLEEVFTDDVRAWTPGLSTGSRAELVEELDRRDEAFSEPELVVTPLDVGGDHACVEWSVALTHTGPLALDAERIVEPTGLRLTLHGVTVAEFRGERICALRQYWDDSTVLDQVGVVLLDR
jgi:ketosteroid isomerase-like protein